MELLKQLKGIILELMKKELVKIAVAKLVKAAFMADFRAWLIALIVKYLVDEVAKPVIDLFFRKVGYQYEVIEGRHLLKKIESSNNAGEWNEASNNV